MNIISKPQKFPKWNVPIGGIELSEDKSDTGSVPDESSDSEAPAAPIEVKITNAPAKDIKWNDERDDIEYDEIVLTDEEKDI